MYSFPRRFYYIHALQLDFRGCRGVRHSHVLLLNGVMPMGAFHLRQKSIWSLQVLLEAEIPQELLKTVTVLIV